MVFQWFSLQSIFCMAYFQIFDSFWNQPFHFWLYDAIKKKFFLLLSSQLLFSSLSLLTLGLVVVPQVSLLFFLIFYKPLIFLFFWEVGGLEIANLFQGSRCVHLRQRVVRRVWRELQKLFLFIYFFFSQFNLMTGSFILSKSYAKSTLSP